MPTRSPVHIRGRRAWGTRFDSLNTSPVRTLPSSIPLSVSNGPETPQSTRLGDWADDEVATTLFTPKDKGCATPSRSIPNSTRLDSPKMPHNASVFVGSLPPDVDETELSHQLAQHLSQYAIIQNIKIVRDAKGGVCAFVQCETAAQAANIVSQSQANPKLFMGRQLRCENARAYRTLWISYRKPMRFVPKDDIAEGDAILDESGVRGHFVEMDPPDAMRIWRPIDSRYPMICYRSDARNFDESKVDASHSSNSLDSLDGAGVLFADLPFDGNTIKKIATAFGPLESFKRYSDGLAHDSNSPEENASPYPPGHEGPRCNGMDEGVWEIKWQHRDDCVCALTTLKRVPHVMVSKAIQQPYQVNQDYVRQPFSPRFPSLNIPHSPLLLGRSREGNPFMSPSTSLSPQRSFFPPRNMSSLATGLTLRANTRAGNDLAAASAEHSDAGTPQHKNGVRVPPTWLASDFPPLQQEVASNSRNIKALPPLRIPNTTASDGEVGDINESSSVETLTNADAERDIESDGSAKSSSDSSPRRPQLSHRRSMSNPVPNFQSTRDDSQSSAGESSAHITPITTPSTLGHFCPSFTCAGPDKCLHKFDAGFYASEQTFHREQDIDPKTLFVGGLEATGVHAWGIDKLRRVFEKYGVVEDIRLICPSNKKTLFAFVTFSDENAPLRAIAEEHNRVYDGRIIRVQLRDRQPNRNMFKLRSRMASGRQREFHQDGSTGGRHDAWRYGRNHDARAGSAAKVSSELPAMASPYMRPPEQMLQPDASYIARNPREMHYPLATPADVYPGLPGHSQASSESQAYTAQNPPDALSTTSITPPPPFTPDPVAPNATSLPTNGSHNHPRGWPQTVGHVPYAMPYASYPAFMPAVYPAVAASTAGADGSLQSANASMQWGPMYRLPMLAPYPPYPYIPYMPQNAEAQRSTPRPSSPTKSLHGMISPGAVPNEYGGHAHPPPKSASDGVPTSTGSTMGHHLQPSGSAPGHPVNNHLPYWPGYTPPSPYYSYPFTAPPPMQQPLASHLYMSGQHFPSSANGSWYQAPSMAPHGPARPPTLCQPPLLPHSSTSAAPPTPQNMHMGAHDSQQHRPPPPLEMQTINGGVHPHAPSGRTPQSQHPHAFSQFQHGRNNGTSGGRSPSSRHGGN